MKPAEILVTSYVNPDLDGTAGVLAYKVILVDASDLSGISPQIDPARVIEVIDHRRINEAGKFPNAKIQIELVGAAATLIAEKFFKTGIFLSWQSAALLYSGIVWNTIAFQARVTTKRDCQMAGWLKDKVDRPDQLIHQIFLEKSKMIKPTLNIFADNLAKFEFGCQRLGIVQLEILNAAGFVRANLAKINRVLSDLKRENKFDLVFLTCIDLKKAGNFFVAVDEITEDLLTQTINLALKNGVAQRKSVIMRKEITPLLKEFLAKDRLGS